MQADDSSSQIELITGDLILMLVELGVESSVLGSLSVRFPPKLAARLADHQGTQANLDLSDAQVLLRRIRRKQGGAQ